MRLATEVVAVPVAVFRARLAGRGFRVAEDADVAAAFFTDLSAVLAEVPPATVLRAPLALGAALALATALALGAALVFGAALALVAAVARLRGAFLPAPSTAAR